jgi:iron complex outermembrane receptor protein
MEHYIVFIQYHQRNSTVADPANSALENFIIDLGKTRVQGIEFDLKGEITRGFNAIFNYAFTENKITESNDPVSNPVGMRIPAMRNTR